MLGHALQRILPNDHASTVHRIHQENSANPCYSGEVADQSSLDDRLGTGMQTCVLYCSAARWLANIWNKACLHELSQIALKMTCIFGPCCDAHGKWFMLARERPQSEVQVTNFFACGEERGDIFSHTCYPYHSFQNHYRHEMIVFKLFNGLQFRFLGVSRINLHCTYIFLVLSAECSYRK